jgi:hypothetical protein
MIVEHPASRGLEASSCFPRTCSFFSPGPRAGSSRCALRPPHAFKHVRIFARFLIDHLPYSRVVCSATGNEDHARGRNRNSRVPEFDTRQLTRTPPLAGTAMTTPGSTRVWDRLYVGRVIRCDCPRSEDHQHVPICSPPPHRRLAAASSTRQGQARDVADVRRGR